MDASILGVDVAGQADGVFAVDGPRSFVLKPGESRTLDLETAPTVGGLTRGRLTVTYGHAGLTVGADLRVDARSWWTVVDGVATARLAAGETWDHTLRVTKTAIELEGRASGMTVVDRIALADLTGVVIRGTTANDRIRLDLASRPTVDVAILGGTGYDELVGPARDSDWTVSGHGSGDVDAIRFQGMERLTGAADVDDTFLFRAAGTLDGRIDGGAGGFDSLVVNGRWETLRAAATDGSSGRLKVGDKIIRYFGLEPITIPSPVANLVIDLTGADDSATLAPSATGLRLSGTFSSTSTFESHDFAIPTGSLTIRGGDGDDAIRISGQVGLGGADVTLDAETVTVGINDGIDTRDRSGGATAGDSGDITLTGETIVMQSGSSLRADVDAGSAFDPGAIKIAAEKAPLLGVSLIGTFSPLLVADDTAKVTTTNATIAGGDIEISARGATLTEWDDPGDYWDQITEQLFGVLTQAPDLLASGLSPISGQVKIQKASAGVSLTDTKVTGSGGVSVTAKAESDASFDATAINADITKAAGKTQIMLIVGYGEADSTAELTLAGTTQVRAHGTVVLHADAKTKAEVETSAHANSRVAQSAPDCDVAGSTKTTCVEYAVSVAIGVTNEIAHVTIGPSVLVRSEKGNIDVASKGSVGTSSTAETAVFQDGTLGVAVSVSVDDADILTRVNGTLIAADPTAILGFAGGSASVVSVADDTITVSVPESLALERGQDIVYHADGAVSIGGLVDGRTYIVESVVDVSTSEVDGEAYVTQRVRLARGGVIDLDASQVDPQSTHTIAEVAVVTVSWTQVSDDNGDLAIALSGFSGPGMVDGRTVRYLGPSSSSSIDVAAGSFKRDPGGDRITVISGTRWSLLPVYPNERIKIMSGTNKDLIVTVASISPDGRTLILKEVNTVTVVATEAFEVLTQPDTAKPIEGLDVNGEYVIDVVGTDVKFRDPADPTTFVAFTSAGKGIQGFAFTRTAKSFDPSAAVDDDADTIEIQGHGLQTGDLVVYTTDHSRSTQQQLYGFVGVDPTTAYPVGSPITVPDAPISGLRSAYAYFVVVVDADHIRLVGSKVAALRAEPIDLTSVGAGDDHFSLPGRTEGVTILATLGAENGASTTVELSDSEESWTSVGQGVLTGDLSSIAGLARNGQAFATDFRESISHLFGPVVDPQGGNGSSGPDGVDIAATVSVNVFTHTVQAIVGAGATIQSGSDVAVEATIEESVSLGSDAEATRNGADDNSVSQYSTAKREDVEFGIAVAVGIYTSIARATVENAEPDGSGGTKVARIDAAGETSVHSAVDYPLLIDDPTEVINPALTMKEAGLDGFEFLTDGTLGFGSLFNLWVTSLGGDPEKATADKFVFGGGFGIVIMSLESRATVGKGALINQGADPAYRSDGQSVSVTATTDTELVSVGSIAALNLSLTTMIENGPDWSQAIRRPGGARSGIVGALRNFVNPYGVSGQRGIGAAVIGSKTTTVTVAEISPDAKVRTGLGGGLEVHADQDLLDVAVAYTGTRASDFGLTASVIVGIYDSTTTAGIDPGVVIRGGGVDVAATDHLDRYDVAGQLLKTAKIGIGVSVGIVVTERDTRAYIGRPDFLHDPLPVTRADIDVAGPVDVAATTEGEIVQVVVGGAIALPSPDEQDQRAKTGRPPTTSPADRLQLSLAITISVAVNDLDDSTLAYIDSADVSADSVSVEAESGPLARAVTVAASFSLSKSQTQTRALGTLTVNIAAAGAISVNVFRNDVRAAITRSDITTAGDADVYAHDDSTMAADGGGVAIAISLGDRRGVMNGSVGIAIGINDVESNVYGYIEDATVDAGADVMARARSETSVEAVTIAFAFAGGTGGSASQGGVNVDISGAGSGSGNTITKATAAWIRRAKGTNEPGIQAGGGVKVHAKDVSTIVADAGGFAISARIKSAQSKVTSIAIGLSAARNDIDDTVDAVIGESTVFAAGDLADGTGSIVVGAVSQPTIKALTMAGAGTLGQGAGSGAGSGNDISQTTRARIETSQVTAAGAEGRIRVYASDTATIDADAGGVSLALDLLGGGSDANLAVGIGLAINDIVKQVLAVIGDETKALATGNIDVTAESSSTIMALTFGAALGVAKQSTEQGGLGIQLAAGGAGSHNRISGKVTASGAPIDLVRAAITGGSTVTSSGGAVTVRASDTSTIDADGAGVAIAAKFGKPAKPGVSAAVGIGVAVNDLFIADDKGEWSADDRVVAMIQQSTVTAADGVTVKATTSSHIDALTLGGAADGQVGGVNGLNLAGGGAGSRNEIHVTTLATIRQGGGRAVTATDGPVEVIALDDSSITADAGALGVSIATGPGNGVNLAFGIAVAINTIADTVQAIVDGTTVVGDGVTVTADTSHKASGTPTRTTIDSLALGIAATFHLGTGDSSGLDLAGGVSVAINDIHDTIEALVRNGAVVDGGSGIVEVSAIDRSLIHSDAGGFALTVGIGTGDGTGVEVAAGVSVAENTVANTVDASLDHAIVDGSSIRVKADAGGTIEALVISGAGSVAFRVGSGGAASGAVAFSGSTNTVGGSVTASVVDSKTSDPARNAAIVAGGGGVSVSASDTRTIVSKYGSGSLAFSMSLSEGGVAFSGSVAVALASNTIKTNVDAFMADSTVWSGAGISIGATSGRTLTAEAAAVGISVAIQVSEVPIGISLTGVGITSTNIIEGRTTAYVDSSTVHATRDVSVTATDGSTLDARIGAGGFSLGTLAITVVIVKSDNRIANAVRAYLVDATVTSTAGGVTVEASSTPKITHSDTWAVAVTVGIDGAGSDQESDAVVGGVTDASVGDGSKVTATAGAVKVAASTDATVDARMYGGAGAILISGSTIGALASITRATRASVEDGTTVRSKTLDVTATAPHQDASVYAEVGSVGLLGSGVGSACREKSGRRCNLGNSSSATVDADVEAWIGRASGAAGSASPTIIDVSGAVTVASSVAHSTATSETRGGSGSVVIAVTVLSSAAEVKGDTRAYVGRLGSATGVTGARFDVGSLAIDASATGVNATAKLLSVAIGLIGGGSGPAPGEATAAKAKVGGSVQAFVAPVDPATPAVTPATIAAAGNVGVSATSSSDAYGEAKGGAGSFGIAVVVLRADADDSRDAKAWVGDTATIEAGGLSVEATAPRADARTVLITGAGSLIAAGGKADGESTVGGTVEARIGDGAHVTVTDGVVLVDADAHALANADVLIATASIVAGGRDSVAKATISQSVIARVGRDASVRTEIVTGASGTTAGEPGDVIIKAVGSAEGDATAESYGGNVGFDGDAANTTTTVTPVIRATIGSGSAIDAAGSASVSASYVPAGKAPSTRIFGVDLGDDTLSLDVGLRLRDGDIVTYAGGSDPIRVPTAPSGGSSVPLAGNGRLYGVIVIGPGRIQLGASFPGSGEGVGVDAERDTITFPGDHHLATGDVVRLESLRIGSFDPKLAVDDASDTITLPEATELQTGDPVVYRNTAGPAVVGLSGGTIYYVIVDPNQPRLIQLASTRANALAGTYRSIAPTTETGSTDHLDGVVVGLQAGTPYRVRVIDGRTIKLMTGDEKPAQRFSGVNVKNDQISVVDGQGNVIAHGFSDGQAVTYRAPSGPGIGARTFGSQFVDVFALLGQDPSITTSGNPPVVSTVEVPDANNIFLRAHGLSFSELVRYKAPAGGTEIDGLKSGSDYRVLVINVDQIQLTRSAAYVAGSVVFRRDSSNGDSIDGDSIRRSDGAAWSSYGFAAGQVIHVSGSLYNDGTYTIASVSGDTIVLTASDSLSNATWSGASFYGNAIAIKRAGSSTAVHSLTPVSQLPIEGLTDGITYYVRYVDSTHFALASTPSGNARPIDGTGRTATSTIGTEGVDLGAAGGTQRLHLDFVSAGTVSTGTPPTYPQSLKGPGGVDLSRLIASSGDGQSTATAKGGAGAAVSGAEPRASLSLSPTVIACVGWTASDTCGGTAAGTARTHLHADRDVTVSAASTAKVRAFTDVHNGGVIQVGVARGKATLASSTKASIGDRSDVSAGRDIDLSATAKDDLTNEVVAAGGGVVAVSDADSAGTITFDTKVTVGTLADVVAGGDLAAATDTSIDGTIEATSFAAGGAFWSSADANHANLNAGKDSNGDWQLGDYPAGLTISGSSNVEIAGGAIVTGDTVRLRAIVSRLHGTAHAGAEAFVTLLIGVGKAYAEANVFLDSTAKVSIAAGAARRTTVTGWRGVDIIARTKDLRIERRASRLGVGLIPPQAAVAGPCDGDNGSCYEVLAGASEHWTEGSLKVTSTVDTDRGAHVVAGVRQDGTVLETPGQKGASSDPYPALALFVDANTASAGDDHGEWKLWTDYLTPGIGEFDHYRGSITQTAPVVWDADVTVLGGMNGTPTLVVAADGIVRSVNEVKLRCDRALSTSDFGPGETPRCVGSTSSYMPKVGETVDPDGSGSFAIDDITNGGFGNVLMSSRAAGDDGIANGIAHSQGYPLFDFKVTLPGATLVDRSTLAMTVNGIDVVKPLTAPGTKCAEPTAKCPIVWLVTADDDAGPANGDFGFEFDLQQSAGESFVDIQKLGDAALALNGTINNPAGWTRILDALGDILSSNPSAWITTNALDIEATAGSIGSTAAGGRINVELVQSLDRRRLADATDDVVRTTQLFALAQGLVALRLEGHDRVPTTSSVRPAAFTVHVDRIESTAGSVDVLLEESVHEGGASGTLPVNVKVWEGASSAPSTTPGSKDYDQDHLSHFLPDATNVPLANVPDPAAYPSGSDVIDSTYQFVRRRAKPAVEPATFLGTSVEYLRYLPGAPSSVGVPASSPAPTPRQPGLVADDDIVVKDDGRTFADGTDGLVNVYAYTGLRNVPLASLLATDSRAVLDIDVDGAVTADEITGDMRVGRVRSRTMGVTLTAAESILDGDPADVQDGTDPADVVGVSIVLTATAGSVGTTDRFLETDLLGSRPTLGTLSATAAGGVYVAEAQGDLRVLAVRSSQRDRSLPTDVSLVALHGSIRDGVAQRSPSDPPAPNVFGVRIDLFAPEGGVGGSGAPFFVNSSVAGPGSGRLYVSAKNDVRVTEVENELVLLAARSDEGSVTLTVRDSAGPRAPPQLTILAPLFADPAFTSGAQPEDLVLIPTGLLAARATCCRALPAQADPRSVRGVDERTTGQLLAGIWAKLDIDLWVGDDVTALASTEIVAGRNIRIHGDQAADGSNADPGAGTTMTLRGRIGGDFTVCCDLATPPAADPTDLSRLFGNDDEDAFLLTDTYLGAKTHVFGSNDAFVGGEATADGRDRFEIVTLQTMAVDLGHTLTLDGQEEGDTYQVTTTGSQGDRRDYVINVLDTGSTGDGADDLTVLGTGASDDVFLLRRFASLVEPGWTPDRPAFVALLHDDLGDAQTSDPSGSAAVRPQEVQRIDYDAALDDAGGGLHVRGLGGDDTFATDDDSAITELDGGSGDDTFQFGQLYGSPRNVAAGSLEAADVFDTTPTTRGWLSRGISRDLVAGGGGGDDRFTVYANQALLTLHGSTGDDLFILRSFARATATAACQTNAQAPACVLTPVVVGGQVQYVANHAVDIDGGDGFDKTAQLGTEFADHYVVEGRRIYGGARSTSVSTVEVIEVDGMEGDDTLDARSTAAGVATRLIGGLGSDAFGVTGDIFPDVVLATGDTTTFAKRAHRLSDLEGPLAVEGGESGAARSLWDAVVLPGEARQALPALGPLPAEKDQIDVLNTFSDGRLVATSGTLTSTGLTGFGMSGPLSFPGAAHGEPTSVPGGISWGSIRVADAVHGGPITTDPTRTTLEVVNVLLGRGDDSLTVTGSIVPGPDVGTDVAAVHGGLTVVHGGAGDDTITITGGGGPDSPLVVHGDTSQDGAWYAGDAATPSFASFGTKPFAGLVGNPSTFRFPLADAFTAGGDDRIDASAAGQAGWAIGVVAYGGEGNDTMIGSTAGDILAGGSGDDDVTAGPGDDVVYGDSGVNVDVRSRELTIPTASASTSPAADGLAAGSDTLRGGGADDVIFGDHGALTQDTQEAVVGPDGYARPATLPERIQTTGRLLVVRTVRPTNGQADTITGGTSNDAILGGGGADTISGNEDQDLVFGDHGRIEGAIDLALLPLSMPLATHPFAWLSIDTGPNGGGAGDLIRGGAGDDVLVGGQGADRITGGTEDDDLIGGHVAAGGSDTGDSLDGGAGNDWIAGDNAEILRTGSRLSPRFRVLASDAIYGTDGSAQVTSAPQLDPNASNEERAVSLFDHSVTPAPGTWGNDLIAGGAEDDVLFGQLGNDWIQGDGSVVNDAGTTTIDVRRNGRSVEDWAGIGSDGRDWIEGNGGADTLLGGLGQDDIIGGSSSLYSLGTAALRPDGADRIFGGAGVRLGRNDLGDLSARGHAHDADTILGDNGDLFRLVGTRGTATGGYLTFDYDDYSVAEHIVPRAIVPLDYVAGRQTGNTGAADLVHGESGDDTIHGMTGADVLFGEGQDDDIYGGVGSDRIYGGSGQDGLLGDDGRILTSRNGSREPLNRLDVASREHREDVHGPFTGALVDITGELKKIALLDAFTSGAADIVFGGLGDDFIHGGAGNDALSGAEALRGFYNEAPQATSDPITYDPVTRKLQFYDANDPWAKIDGFVLNFDAYRIDEATGQALVVGGVAVKSNDGRDRIFGDDGHDWIVGGTDCDWLFGGMGDDVLNLDDNLETARRNHIPETDARFRDGDFAFGGAGLDVLIANTAQDRMYDWHGEFNSYWVPFPQYGVPTVNRLFSPDVRDFIRGLAAAAGADPVLAPAEPYDEIALVEPKDALYADQTGGPRDPQDIHGDGPRDDVGGPNLECACDSQAIVHIAKRLWTADGQLRDVDTERGDPVPQLTAGAVIFWRYYVTNLSVATTTSPDLALVLTRLTDDNGTPWDPSDDFVPRYLSGDTDGDHKLDPAETWVFTSEGVAASTAKPGVQVNTVSVEAEAADGCCAADTAESRYTVTVLLPPDVAIAIAKLADGSDADTAATGPRLLAGATVTWTYLVTNPGTLALSGVTVRDDAGTPADPSDDFSPAYVSGDSDGDGRLDPGETWIYQAAGTVGGVAYCNLGTASGTNGTTTVRAADPACYTAVPVTPPPTVGIAITKRVNGADADTLATGPILLPGSTATWTYLVTNKGTVALSGIGVTDDAGTPGDTGDDVSPTYLSGDTNANGKLDPGETWLYQAAGTVGGVAYCNLGTVTGTGDGTTVSAADPACYRVPPPTEPPPSVAIGIAKLADGSDADTAATGPRLLPGATVTWTYLVTNKGTVALSAVTVRDDAGTPADPSDDFSPTYLSGDSDGDGRLDVGETWLYQAVGTAGRVAYCNLGTATASSNGTTVRAADPACYTVPPVTPPPAVAIGVTKLVDGADADTLSSAPVLVPGATVTWTYLVTNKGSVALTSAAVRDDAGTPGDPSDDFDATYVGGDTDHDGRLDVGETWTFQATGIVGSVAYCNLGTATGSANGTTARASEPACYSVPKPRVAIGVSKLVNGADADTLAGGPILVPGSTATWTYLVTNRGTVALTGVTVRDDAGTPNDASDDFSATYVGGDGDGNGRLDVGETWTFRATGTVGSVAYCNVGTATGTGDGTTVSDTDPACYRVRPDTPLVLRISLVKRVNGYDANVAAYPAWVEPGSMLTWTYFVTNTGTATPTSVSLVDDAGTPNDTTDDFSPDPVLGPDGRNVGDTDADGRLDPGETWVYRATGIAPVGPYTNLASACAALDAQRACASDPASIFGVVPDILLKKAINAVDPWHPTETEDAEGPSAPQVPVGSTVVFSYLVTNPGNVALAVAGFLDDNGTPDDPTDDFTPTYVAGDTDVDGLLDPDETWLFVALGTAVGGGAFAVDATATIAAAAGLAAGHGANQPGPYDPIGPGGPSLNGNGGGNAYGRPGAGTVGNADTKNPPGQVTKWPDSPDSGYECDDNNGVGNGNPAHTGCTGLVLYVNIATVLGTVTLSDGTILSVLDSDRAAYTTVAPTP